MSSFFSTQASTSDCRRIRDQRIFWNFLSFFILSSFLLVISCQNLSTRALQSDNNNRLDLNVTNNRNEKDSISQSFDTSRLVSFSSIIENRCQTDAHCSSTSSVCVNGSCMKLCDYNQINDSSCSHFHCDGKLVLDSASLSSHRLIETNNYPNLSRYISNRKCAWILKNDIETNSTQRESSKSTFTFVSSSSSIRLRLNRFSTQLHNDYLYIFAGDSVFSPLLAALSGHALASTNPSSLASNTISFENCSSLFLFFKSDIRPIESKPTSFNSYLVTPSDTATKPFGISVSYEFEHLSSCLNDSCTTSGKESSTLDNEAKHTNNFVEPLNTMDNHSDNLLNSSLRRAQSCSFVYDNALYVCGGYSYSSHALSFLSRLNLSTLVWQHSIDRSPYENEPGRLLPGHRYGHNCALDKTARRFYMFGGVKLTETREFTNELWSYDLEHNVWHVLHEDVRTSRFDKHTRGSDKQPKQYALPLAVSGHCMVLSYPLLLIFGGFSEYYGSTLNLIQEFNLKLNRWRMHSIFATNVNLGYGHTCIVPDGNLKVDDESINDEDDTRHLIYIHGGLIITNLNGFLNSYTNIRFTSRLSGLTNVSEKSTIVNNNFKSSPRLFFLPSTSSSSSISSSEESAANPKLSNTLFAYHLKRNEWRTISTLGNPCYMHTGNSYKDSLVYFGGMCLNRRSELTIMDELRMFNLTSRYWLSNSDGIQSDADFYNPDDFNVFGFSSNKKRRKRQNSINSLEVHIDKHQRFGHSTIVHNSSSLYMFGGYNGFFLKDLLRVELSQLSSYANDPHLNCTMLSESTNNAIKCVVPKKQTRQKRNDESNVHLNEQSIPEPQFNETNYTWSAENSTSFNETSDQKFKSETPTTSTSWSTSTSTSTRRTTEADRSEQLSLIDIIERQRKKHQLTQMIWNTIEFCSLHGSCESCQSYINCVWNNGRCEYYSLDTSFDGGLNGGFGDFESAEVNNYTAIFKKPTCSHRCSEFTSCSNCTEPITSSSFFNHNYQYNSQYHLPEQYNCVWCATRGKCVLNRAVGVYYPFGECMDFIKEREKCFEQTTSPFLLGMSKIDTNSRCGSYYSNCSSCISDENCGWCTSDVDDMEENAERNMGSGRCMEGSQSGAVSTNECQKRWYFANCPSCECNGHATCSRSAVSTSDVASLSTLPRKYSCNSCQNNTSGEYCSKCKLGYFGNPRNNGICERCSCTNEENHCDSTDGRCFCSTKGVIGSRCDQCESPRYTGRPTSQDGTCYYNLSTDYQFTFNLNKESDRYFTRISFVNHPTYGSDDDIDFMVRCIHADAIVNITFVAPYDMYDLPYGSVNRNLNDIDTSDLMNSAEKVLDDEEELDNAMRVVDHEEAIYDSFNHINSPFGFNSKLFWNYNVKQDKANTTNVTRLRSKGIVGRSYGLANGGVYNYYFGPIDKQSLVLTQINCTNSEFKYTFSNRDFNYGDKNRNATFIVYVYNFQTPITIQIAFSRRSRLQLLHFFITFFGCLLSLLAIAFIMWKSKQRYDRYRRQRQIVIQMEYMSSRPFTRLLVDADKNGMMLDTMPNDTTLYPKPINDGKKPSKKNANSYANSAIVDSTSTQDTSNSSRSSLKIMPVGVEPLNNNKSAILTCLLKLPQGNLTHTPKGASPLILASTFVQINSSSPFLNASNMVNSDSLCFADDQTDKMSKQQAEA